VFVLFPFTFKKQVNDEYNDKIEQLFTTYYGLAIYIAKGILHDSALAEDAAMDSFEKIMKIVDKIEVVSCNKTKKLIVIITERTSLNILKKLKRIELVEDDEFNNIPDHSPEIANEVISVEGYNDIVAIIDELTPSLQDTATLALIHDLEDKRIAEILGISHGTVRTRLSRAKSILRSRLARGEHYVKK